MTETAILFGPTMSLAGIITDPPPGVPAHSVGVVILNAGVLHRVGPARVHVSLARELGALGFTSLRFDFSGIGDSLRRDTELPFPDLAVSEALEAFNLLARTRGLDHFAIVGICSGADLGLRAAHEDPRVVAAALVDCFNLITPWFLLGDSARQFFKPKSWLRLLLGRSQTLKVMQLAARPSSSSASAAASVIPSYASFLASLRALSERGTATLLAFSGRAPAYYHYNRGLRWKLRHWPNRATVTIAYMPDTDHTFTLVRNQTRLISLLVRWLVDEASRRLNTESLSILSQPPSPSAEPTRQSRSA